MYIEHGPGTPFLWIRKATELKTWLEVPSLEPFKASSPPTKLPPQELDSKEHQSFNPMLRCETH